MSKCVGSGWASKVSSLLCPARASAAIGSVLFQDWGFLQAVCPLCPCPGLALGKDNDKAVGSADACRSSLGCLAEAGN